MPPETELEFIPAGSRFKECGQRYRWSARIPEISERISSISSFAGVEELFKIPPVIRSGNVP